MGRERSERPPNDLTHLPGGFAAEPSAQAYVRKRRNPYFGAAQPGQVQPLLGGNWSSKT
jgi:hypothetical protein